MERDRLLGVLALDRTIDITTTGAKSGQPQRIEYDLEARISGSPLVEVEFS